MAIVEANSVTFGYSPGEPVIESLSFSLEAGEVLRLHGPNGSGKTTLLKLMARLYEPVAGELLLPPAQKVGWMPDDPALLDYLTLVEQLEFLSALGEPFDYVEALGLAGLADQANILSGSASLGMRRRLSFAIAVALPRRLLLLDEPFNGVDVSYSPTMEHAILERLDAGAAVVFATHHEEVPNIAMHKSLGLSGPTTNASYS